MSIDIDVKNNSEIIGEAFKKAISNGLEAIGMTAETYAKKIVPVDTGRLRNSITHAKDSNAVYIGTNVEYARAVEMGTSTRKAKPYLRPAATEHTSEYKKIMGDALKNG